MLACDNTITLVHHIRGETDTYTCITAENASWFSKTTISTSADGAKSVNSYEVRIFKPASGFLPSVGDYCVKGVIKSVNKIADLKNEEHFRITAIGDNRRTVLPHWRVSGQ